MPRFHLPSGQQQTVTAIGAAENASNAELTALVASLQCRLAACAARLPTPPPHRATHDDDDDDDRHRDSSTPAQAPAPLRSDSILQAARVQHATEVARLVADHEAAATKAAEENAALKELATQLDAERLAMHARIGSLEQRALSASSTIVEAGSSLATLQPAVAAVQDDIAAACAEMAHELEAMHAALAAARAEASELREALDVRSASLQAERQLRYAHESALAERQAELDQARLRIADERHEAERRVARGAVEAAVLTQELRWVEGEAVAAARERALAAAWDRSMAAARERAVAAEEEAGGRRGGPASGGAGGGSSLAVAALAHSPRSHHHPILRSRRPPPHASPRPPSPTPTPSLQAPPARG